MTQTGAQTTNESSAQDEAAVRQYVEQRQVFRVHAMVAVISIAAIMVINLVINLAAGTAGSWANWWSLWVIAGWVPGLAIHGLVVYLNRPAVLRDRATDRQVDKLLAD